VTAVIRAGALRGYAELVRELGSRPEPLLKQCRIAPASLQDEDTLIPLPAQLRLLELTAQRLRVRDFGLRLGLRQDIGILGPLSLAMQHAPNFGEALRCGSRRLFVHTQAVSFSLVPLGRLAADPLELRVAMTESRLGPTRQFMDQCLALVDRIAAFLAPDRYRPLAVHLDHQPQAPLQAYQRAFGAPVRVAQPHAAVLVERRLLAVPLRTVNHVLRKMAFDYLDARYADPDKPVSARVRLVLSHALGAEDASRAWVAQTLAMHPRTLQRHLDREGGSFDRLRDEVRRETVLRYLRSSRLPMTQVAALAGLSQSSALTRCCLRWFGRTPTAVREGEGGVERG